MEAAMCASHHNLKNLTVILDNNGFQQTGSNNQISNSAIQYLNGKVLVSKC